MRIAICSLMVFISVISHSELVLVPNRENVIYENAIIAKNLLDLSYGLTSHFSSYIGEIGIAHKAGNVLLGASINCCDFRVYDAFSSTISTSYSIMPLNLAILPIYHMKKDGIIKDCLSLNSSGGLFFYELGGPVYNRLDFNINYYKSLNDIMGWNLRLGYINYLNCAQYIGPFERQGKIYFSLGVSVGSIFGLGKQMPYPSLEIAGKLIDEDENEILTENEKGSIKIEVLNNGDGKAKQTSIVISVIDNKEHASIDNYNIYMGDLKKYDKVVKEVDLKPISKLSKGILTIEIKVSYKLEGGEIRTITKTIDIKTAPSSSIIKVNIASGLNKDNLPDYIVNTPLENADYQIWYKNYELTIFNLQTGKKEYFSCNSTDKAEGKVQEYFSQIDKSSPQIVLSSSGGTVNRESVELSVDMFDDNYLNQAKIYLNNKLYSEENFKGDREASKTYEFPLLMGENTVKIRVSDCYDKYEEKTIKFTRIKGTSKDLISETNKKGSPKLKYEVYSLDDNYIVIGGKKEGIKVVVTNNGDAEAKQVKVMLSGDSYITSLWGDEKTIGDIKAGESKSVEFSFTMPTELIKKEFDLNVTVKEALGYSPTEENQISFKQLPAEKTTLIVEKIEDVDNDLPDGNLQRDDGYALIVGLSKYSNVNAPKYAKNDAEIFAKYANRVLGIKNNNIKTLLDEKATSATILANLKDWMKKKNGFKVIYFAGHGVPNPDNPKDGEPYLLPYDGDPELISTLVSVEDLASMGSSSSDTTLLFIDACYAGGGDGRTVELASRPLVLAEIKETNAITFAAAEGNQVSKEYEKARHGYFTYYLLLGLKGHADSNKDGWIGTEELHKYVSNSVSEITNYVQEPVLKTDKNVKIGKY